jgi:tRNA pseudouridine65 synthase
MTKLDIKVVYEDDTIIVVNKPNDLLIHHSYYSRNISEESLVQLVRKKLDAPAFLIHRLDRKTSGLVLFAKSKEVAHEVQQQFIEQTIQKRYLALVRGWTKESGIIDTPIKNDEKGDYQDALTHYKTIESIEIERAVPPYSSSRYSLIELEPKTGRTHQLRKHMNKIAHPIIGDPKHGNRHHNHAFIDWYSHSRLFLHAFSLEFTSPSTNKLVSIKTAPPAFWEVNLNDLGFQYFNR